MRNNNLHIMIMLHFGATLTARYYLKREKNNRGGTYPNNNKFYQLSNTSSKLIPKVGAFSKPFIVEAYNPSFFNHLIELTNIDT